MLNDIGQLMADYPLARKPFAELRDALGAEGVATTATRDEIGDWIALTVTLGEADRALRWFDSIGSLLDARPELEHRLRLGLVPLLIDRNRWADIGRLFKDPLAALRQSQSRLEEAKKRNLPSQMTEMRSKMTEALEGIIRRDAGVIAASLLAAGREPEARAVLEEVRRLSPGAETERVLLETATKAGVALP
jgi:hypothetical protein